MDDKLVQACPKDVVALDYTLETPSIDVELLKSIKNFMDDLTNVTTNQNFIDYCTIVNRIDESKVKSYVKLINGFETFFSNNANSLNEGNFENLVDPNISYVTCNGSFSFNFQKTFEEADEENQDIIKDHLNLIWNNINNKNKSPEEVYINKIFNNIRSRFSPNMTKEEQIIIAKDLFSDFQKQNLDISIVIKVACQKAKKILIAKGSEDHSKTFILIDTVEEIDVNNFNMLQFMTLVGKVGALFADEENNPISDLLSSMFNNTFSIEDQENSDLE